MKSDLSKAIDAHRDDLSESLEASNLLVEGLKSTVQIDGMPISVFSPRDRACVDKENDPMLKVICLLNIISRKPVQVCEWFMSYLVNIGHGCIATVIRNDVREAHSNSDSRIEDAIGALRCYYKDYASLLQDTYATVAYTMDDVFVPMTWYNTTANRNPDIEEERTDYTKALMILKDDKNVLNRIAIVTGNSGCGKTVFAQKIAYDWAVGNASAGQFKMVILVSLGNICAAGWSKSQNYKYESILHAAVDQFLRYPSYFPFGPEELHNALQTYSRQHRNDVLFICDGYDEYQAGTIEQLDRIKHQPVRSRKDLPPMGSSLLITSRPFYTDELVVAHRFSLVEFDEDHLSNFVKSFFKDREGKKDKTKNVLESIRLNPRLAFLAKVPMMLAMLCHIVLESFDADQSGRLRHISTKASIYKYYCDFLVRRTKAQRDQTAPGNMEDISTFEDIPGNESLFKICYQYLSSEVPSDSIRSWINSMISSIWFKMGLIVGNKSYVTNLQTTDGIPLTFVHRSFTEYFASKELVRMIMEDTFMDTMLLVGMRNTTPVDRLPPLSQFMHRFKKSITFRYDINQVVEFAYDVLHVLDPQRRQGLKHALVDTYNIDITKNRGYLNDATVRQQLTPHEIMLDIDFKDTAHFCSTQDCPSKTIPSVSGSFDSGIYQACFCGHESLFQCETLETNSLKYVLLHAELEKLSVQNIKQEIVQLLRVTKERIYIIIDLDNYNQESSVKLNQFAERLNDVIIQVRNESVRQFDEMSLRKGRRKGKIEKDVYMYLFCLRWNTDFLNFQCWSLLENIIALSLNGINITTDEVQNILEYTNRYNNRTLFGLQLTRNGFSENDYLKISMFIDQKKDVLKQSKLELKFDTESPLPYSTVKRCLQLSLREQNVQDKLIVHNYIATNINLTDVGNLQDFCDMITSKVCISIKNNMIDQYIRIIMKRCSLIDESIDHLKEMIESIIKASIESKVKINKCTFELFHNKFSYTGELMLHSHALKFKYILFL